MNRSPVIVTPRTAPPPPVVLRPIATGLGALILAGIWVACLGRPTGTLLLSLIHLSFVAGLLTLASAAAIQLGAATTGQTHPRPGLLGGFALGVPAGGALLSVGFALGAPVLLATGGVLAFTGVASVFGHALRRIGQSRSLRPLHVGLLLGFAGFLAAAAMGLAMALGLALGRPSLLVLLPWHLALAFAAGFGALLAGVSWQLLPMFGRARQVQGLLGYLPSGAFAAAALLGAFAWGRIGAGAAWLLAIAAAIHLAITVWSLARGSGAKPPPYTGLAHLASAALLCLTALLLARGLYGDALLAAFGGFAIAILGYLERILPFIVFEAHLSRRTGRTKVPKLQDILPAKGRHALLALYLAALVLAMATSWGIRLFGVALALMALRLFMALRNLPPRTSGSAE